MTPRIDGFKDLQSLDPSSKYDYLYIDSGMVTHEEMRLLLECQVSEPTGGLHVMCNPGLHFKYESRITCCQLNVSCGFWITRQTLLNLSCRSVRLSGCTLKEKDLNQFLRHWMRSDDTKLEHILIFKKSPSGQRGKWKFNRIVKGVPTFQGSQKRLEAASYREHLDIRFEDGLDIRRPSDGMLGTVMIVDGSADKYGFLFVVWHVLNPNRP